MTKRAARAALTATLILASGLEAQAARRWSRRAPPPEPASSSVPLPPTRPAELGGAPGAAAASETAAPASEAAKPPAQAGETPKVALPPEVPPVDAAVEAAALQGSCLARLKKAGWEAEQAAQPRAAQSACVIKEPVRLKALTRPGAPVRRILLPDQPVVACEMAESLGAWVGDIVSPVLEVKLESPLAKLRTGPGFECRSRNRVPGAKLSAHGLGIAVDIAGFELANGKTLTVPPQADPARIAAFQAIRVASCGWFTTVLGPGSDAAHGNHLHVDIMQHGNSGRYRICQ